MTLASEDELYRKLSGLFDRMMKRLFQEEGSQLRIDLMADPEVQAFIEEHAGILDSSFSEVRMSDTMRSRLQESDYIFSGIKTFHELNQAFPSLLDDNGDRKPFQRFLNDVRGIDSTYNRNYLRAEYNFCQASASMAARWEQIEADGDRYLLQYRTAADDKVREEHAALHGITLPPSDSFWKTYYPPNGWNCRCTAVQVRRGKHPETPHDEAMKRALQATEKDKKGIFQFNSGQQRKAFPDYNPYTISRCRDCDIAQGKLSLAYVPENELCAACKLLHQCVGDRAKTQSAIERIHYMHEMEPLLEKKVTVNGNGHDMSVSFSKRGNKHLLSDTYGRCNNISKDDLKNLDKILASSTFVTKTQLSKDRKDDIRRFYYYRAEVNGRTVYLNVAETDYRRPSGKWFHDRFVFSVTDSLKKE